jgi:glycosidase
MSSPFNGLKSLKNLNFKPRGNVFASPDNWKDQIIYHLLIDRFNSSEQNIPPYNPKTTPLLRNNLEGDNWQGGKIKGITDRLDYIRDLGCNTVRLSPLFKNRNEMNTYHGYGIQNFLEVDPRFGTLRDLQALTKKAHKMDMYIILEIVLNYTGDNWAYPGKDYCYYYTGERYNFGHWRVADPVIGIQWPDDAIWPIEFQNPDWYNRKGQIRNWSHSPEFKEGDFFSLKKLDILNLKVLSSLIQIYKYWIAIADIDGYIIDAAKHIEESSAAIFVRAIKEYSCKIGKRNFFIFGEINERNKYMKDYLKNLSLYYVETKNFSFYDSLLDYPLAALLEGVIKGYINPEELIKRYEGFNENDFGYSEKINYFITFIDNHDQESKLMKGRFLYNNIYIRQIILAIGYLLTSLGIPCIYYGSEQGFDGGGEKEWYQDKYKRECMFGGNWGAFSTSGHHFFNRKNSIYKEISKIAKIRQHEIALRYGRQYFREISNNGLDFNYPFDSKCSLAYSRILDDIEILIVINLDNNIRDVWVTVDSCLSPEGRKLKNLLKPEKKFIIEIIGKRNAVKIKLNPYEIAILKLY